MAAVTAAVICGVAGGAPIVNVAAAICVLFQSSLTVQVPGRLAGG